MVSSAFSHYTILEKLGEGGMGVVYKAHDTRLDRFVALKFLPSHLVISADVIARFHQEAKAISALNHPNIATIYDFDEAEGQQCIVLEFIPGGTLKEKLRHLAQENNRLPIEEVVTCGIQIAEALELAHAHGIIHRDVKTDNVMVTAGGSVKVTDFGLARLRGAPSITRSGSTVGTTAYMSPEQLRGEEADPRSDIFSLGVLLYELATNQLPFHGEHEPALMYSIVNESPAPVRSLRADAPEKLEQVIARCLEKGPGDRFRRAGKVAAALRSIDLRNAPPVMTASRPRRRIWMAAGTIAAVTGLALSFLIFPHRSAPANSRTVAVLPFVNMSDDQQDDYFSDGMTEDILTQLSKIADLKVISRTSIMHYKRTTKTIQEIGKELNAGVVLEGSVRHYAGQVRITAQLIDARDDEALWAETYDKEFTQVFAIQSDVAQKIASALQAKLSPAEKERIEKRSMSTMEAYDLLLQAKYWRDRPGREGFEKAVGFLKQALTIDARDARIWACLSTVYSSQANYGYVGANEGYDLARESAARALTLDETLADAHSAMGRVKLSHDFDWAGADAEFRRGLALEPGNIESLLGSGTVARVLGRLDDAILLNRQALELDPMNLRLWERLGEEFFCSGLLDEAASTWQKALEINPDGRNFHGDLGEVSLF
ncbi:MAG TPA: protein kinase, partial [Bacteroidota bacterium]|nr:protein kinase [Bacteroidota bacterium]